MRGSVITRSICVCAILGATSPAWATLKQGFQPRPLNLGSFLVTPQLNLKLHYTDNVKARESGIEGDLVTTISPSLKVQKNIRDHEFELDTKLHANKHISNSDEDTVGGHISLSSLLIAKRSFKIPLSLKYESSHIERHQETNIFSPKEPTRRQTTQFQGGFIYQPNRLRVEMIGHYQKRRYDNGAQENGVAVIRSDDDFNQAGLHTKVSYNLRNGATPFLAYKSHKASFERGTHNGVDFSGNPRDHNYHSILAGLEFEHDSLSGEIGLGHNGLYYDESSIDDLSTLELLASLNWNPTQKSEFSLNYTRTAMEDSAVESAYVSNATTLNYGYEIRNDILLNAQAGLSNHDYETGREDSLYHGQVAFDFILSPSMQAHANFTSRKRNSDAIDAEYYQNLLMFGITGNL